MGRVFLKFSILLLFICLGFTACVQSVDLDLLLEEAGKNTNGGPSLPPGGPPIEDHSPELSWMDGTEEKPIPAGGSITISLSAATGFQSSTTLKVTNAEDFESNSIEWYVNSAHWLSGVEATVNTSTAPFNGKGEHHLRVEALYIGIPYDVIIIINVDD